MPFENLVKRLGFKKITFGYDSFQEEKKDKQLITII